jgi:hypothetical protein
VEQTRLDTLEKKLEEVSEFTRSIQKRNVFLKDHLDKLESEQTQFFRSLLETRYKISEIEALCRRNKEKLDFYGQGSL